MAGKRNRRRRRGKENAAQPPQQPPQTPAPVAPQASDNAGANASLAQTLYDNRINILGYAAAAALTVGLIVEIVTKVRSPARMYCTMAILTEEERPKFIDLKMTTDLASLAKSRELMQFAVDNINIALSIHRGLDGGALVDRRSQKIVAAISGSQTLLEPGVTELKPYPDYLHTHGLKIGGQVYTVDHFDYFKPDGGTFVKIGKNRIDLASVMMQMTFGERNTGDNTIVSIPPGNITYIPTTVINACKL